MLKMTEQSENVYENKGTGWRRHCFLNVCDAPKAQVGQFMTIALTCPFGTSQTPQVGVCASRNWRAENRISTEQSENVYENKGPAQKSTSPGPSLSKEGNSRRCPSA
jgi:hypothetical protein